MSVDSSVSCASCHLPQHAFSDTVAFSPMVGPTAGNLNAPTLANVAYHPYYTREGGVPTLKCRFWFQFKNTMNLISTYLIADRMKQDSDYVQSSQEVIASA
ncbi:MAG: cytochrome-c peroxidase [Lewinellaceae bacterium]|nr:cytochrome-c peroxidase [Lewinellaceae bacterium]